MVIAQAVGLRRPVWQICLPAFVVVMVTGCHQESSESVGDPHPVVEEAGEMGGHAENGDGTAGQLLECFLEFGEIGISGGFASYHDVMYELKDDVEQREVVEEIVLYLKKDPSAKGSRVDWRERDLFVGVGEIHPRDMWAMVLADLTGHSIRIPASTAGPHEEQIAELLRKVEEDLGEE